MRLRYTGSFEVPAPRERVYAFLTDPSRVAKTFPGVQEVSIADENSFSVRASLGVGSLRGTMSFKLRFEEKRPPEHAKVVGRGTGLQSTADLSLSFDLEEGGGGTRVSWVFEGDVGGLVGTLGGRVLDSVAKGLIEEVISNIRRFLEEP